MLQAVRTSSLKDLLDHYGSNKGATYGGLYDVLLAPIRKRIRVLIEVGIGTLNPDAISTMAGFAIHDRYRPGGSLRAFRDYLPDAMIHGIDCIDDTQFSEPGIVTHICDSTKETPWDSKGMIEFADVVIDDACHEVTSQIATFHHFMPLVMDGGLYVMEDVYPQNEEQVRAEIAGYPFICAKPVFGCDWLAFVVRKC